MISVILTDDGSFNVIGTADGMFIIQGHLNNEQLQELHQATTNALKEAERWSTKSQHKPQHR